MSPLKILHHCRAPRSFCVALCSLIALLGMGLAQAAPQSRGVPANFPTLTRAGQVRGLTPDQAALDHRVRLRGVVLTSLLRSPDDIVLLATPSWWMLRRALLVLGCLVVLSLAAVLWLLTLRTRVREQNAVIRELFERETALQKRYREVFENANDAIFTQDLEWNITSCNKASVLLTGYTRPELLRMKVSDLLPPEHMERAREMFRQKQGGASKTTAEFEIVSKDGHRVPVEVSTTLMKEGDTILGVSGVARDIRERKRAEAALRENQARLQALISSIDEIVFEFDENGTYLNIWTGNEKLLTRPRSQFIGKTISDIWGEPVTRPIVDAIRQALRTGQGADLEYALETEEGRRWFLAHLSPIPSADGSYKTVCLLTRDITERKRAEEALAESEERFRSLVQNATVGIYRATPDGRILMANPTLVRMLGFDSFEELAARNLEREGFEPSYSRRAFKEQIEREGEVKSLEAAWTKRDGSVVFVRESARAARADDGSVLYYDGIVEDVTQRKQAEESMRQLSGRLLRIQDEERRHIARELHDTTAQSLAALAINLSVVKDSAPDLKPRASACLSESLQLAEQCSREVRTLSYLLHPPLLDEVGLTSALRWYTGGFAQRSGIEVHLDVSPELARLPADVELTFYRIVQEGLTNIHLHSGSKTARIRLERRPEQIVLTMADEGHGIPARILERAEGYAPEFGVGIQGVRERMRQLGGRLEISSSSEGTTLTAILPLGRDET
jgi:PAS domain S-box-containing protein